MMKLASLWTPALAQLWNLINWCCCLFHFLRSEGPRHLFSQNPQSTQILWSTVMPGKVFLSIFSWRRRVWFLCRLQHQLAQALYSALMQRGCADVDPTGMTEGLSLLQQPTAAGPREAATPQYVLFPHSCIEISIEQYKWIFPWKEELLLSLGSLVTELSSLAIWLSEIIMQSPYYH